jgi:hypothetical protein
MPQDAEACHNAEARYDSLCLHDALYHLKSENGGKGIRKYDLEAGKAGVLRPCARPWLELWKCLGLGLCHGRLASVSNGPGPGPGLDRVATGLPHDKRVVTWTPQALLDPPPNAFAPIKYLSSYRIAIRSVCKLCSF